MLAEKVERNFFLTQVIVAGIVTVILLVLKQYYHFPADGHTLLWAAYVTFVVGFVAMACHARPVALTFYTVVGVFAVFATPEVVEFRHLPWAFAVSAAVGVVYGGIAWLLKTLFEERHKQVRQVETGLKLFVMATLALGLFAVSLASAGIVLGRFGMSILAVIPYMIVAFGAWFADQDIQLFLEKKDAEAAAAATPAL